MFDGIKNYSSLIKGKNSIFIKMPSCLKKFKQEGYFFTLIKTEEVQNFESTGKYPSAALPAGKPRFKIEDFEGKAGITIILSAVLLLKNRVFNCVFFGMIFNVSV